MVSHAGMNNARLEALLRESFANLCGEDGMWSAAVDDLELFVLSDEQEDRVRIMIPVAQAERADRDLMYVLLHANYNLARDAKYAIHDGLVWCTFLHRLSWLTAPELDSALRSVITLARNTGSTFSSVDSGLVFDQG